MRRRISATVLDRSECKKCRGLFGSGQKDTDSTYAQRLSLQSSGLGHSWVIAMEEFIHQQNLARYRKMLSEKTHEPQRQTILLLLADEEAEEALSPSSIDEYAP
jgi:hypothetical protein